MFFKLRPKHHFVVDDVTRVNRIYRIFESYFKSSFFCISPLLQFNTIITSVLIWELNVLCIMYYYSIHDLNIYIDLNKGCSATRGEGV